MHSDLLKNYQQLIKNYQPSILIVDNDRDNLFFASCIIESMGMKYTVVDDSEKCLEMIYQLLPDIVLLDVVMPKINGLEIVETIKQDRSISYISIIAVTGLTRVEDKSKIMKAGFDDYVRKPYLIEELEAMICNNFKCSLV